MQHPFWFPGQHSNKSMFTYNKGCMTRINTTQSTDPGIANMQEMGWFTMPTGAHSEGKDLFSEWYFDWG